MQKFNFTDMIGGWFVGDFTPAAFTTDKFEVCYKQHNAGEYWDTHYHKEATEINLLISGRMKINGIEIVPGEIFVIPPYYVSTPEFLEDCELVIIKTPSVIGDKYTVK
jgi:mannose-6-phosphate isomerase-like protein (cupin superfamily)